MCDAVTEVIQLSSNQGKTDTNLLDNANLGVGLKKAIPQTNCNKLQICFLYNLGPVYQQKSLVDVHVSYKQPNFSVKPIQMLRVIYNVNPFVA